MNDEMMHRLPKVHDDIRRRFDFHPANQDTGPLHTEVRAAHRQLAEWVVDSIPDSPERDVALEHLQSAMMWCNAAVAYR